MVGADLDADQGAKRDGSVKIGPQARENRSFGHAH